MRLVAALFLYFLKDVQCLLVVFLTQVILPFLNAKALGPVVIFCKFLSKGFSSFARLFQPLSAKEGNDGLTVNLRCGVGRQQGLVNCQGLLARAAWRKALYGVTIAAWVFALGSTAFELGTRVAEGVPFLQLDNQQKD